MTDDSKVEAGHALADLCRLHGFRAAESVIYAELGSERRGVQELNPDLAETRDGREEAIRQLQSAFEDGVLCLVIAQSAKSITEIVGPLPVRTQGYA